MGKKITDAAFETVTDVELTDLVMLVRSSEAADGTKKITVDNFMASADELRDRHIYVAGGQMLEVQSANAIIAIHVPTEDITIPSADNRSCGKALVAATGDTVFSLKKNGVEFGTMTVLAGGTVPTFNIGSDTSFTAGSDYLTVVNPATPDTTLAVFGFSIWGRR